MIAWKIVSHKKLLQSKFFDVEQEKLILPNGQKTTYEMVIRKSVAMIAPLTDDHQLYMVKQYRHMLKDYSVELAAGHLDEGETALAAAKRELREETGLEARHWEEISVIESSASVIRSKVHLFLAKDLEEGKSTPEDEEGEIELIKIPLKQAVEMVTSGQVNTSVTMYAILLLDKFVKEGKL
jgi:8-oxo-dGTP pyrophosphatase MutT (NUDIX family)